jgi:tetratricopeptide (TPR) repeat protein
VYLFVYLSGCPIYFLLYDRKYDEAQQSHVAALRLNPSNPSTHSFLGLVYSLAGQSMKAVEEYHKALEITKEDTLTMQLLNKELELLADVDPLQGIFSVLFTKDTPTFGWTDTHTHKQTQTLFSGV